jgi:hypothetical protein
VNITRMVLVFGCILIVGARYLNAECDTAISAPFGVDTYNAAGCDYGISSPFGVSTQNIVPVLAFVSGTVSDQANSLPIDGVSLQLYPPVAGGSTLTNDSGLWELAFPGGSGYELRVIADGYETSIEYNLNFPSGQSTEHNIQLQTEVVEYTDYRIVPMSMVPNTDPLDIPEGGFGYAWFVVEGQVIEGSWFPVSHADILAEDAQGNQISCEANLLPYEFLASVFHMQHAGAFAVKVPAAMIGNGSPWQAEILTVIEVDGLPLLAENQVSFNTQVIPYSYSADWGYRLYAQAGAGVTAGIATATGFAGGGSGSTISLELEGLGTNPSWSQFRILRRTDLFLGVEVKLGPPTLIDLAITPRAEVTASFPYQEEYEFDLDALQGLEAAVAFYLFMEPSIIATVGASGAGQIATNFMSWIVEALIAGSGENDLGVSRIGDESGLDVEGSVGVDVGDFEFLSELGLGMSPGLGASAHFGGSVYESVSGLTQRHLYIGGGYSAGLGLKIIPFDGVSTDAFYPFLMDQPSLPSQMDVGFDLSGSWQDDVWQNTVLSASLESNSNYLNIFDLPGETQEYSAWLEIESQDLKNTLNNVTQLPAKMMSVGSSAVNAMVDDSDFKNDFVHFMDAIYEQQNNGESVQLAYGIDAADKTAFSINADFEFPVPIFPAVVINLGGGLEANTSRNYNLGEGYLVKGLPYLRNESPVPPDIALTFPGVMNEIWNQMLSGDVYSELVSVVVSHLRNVVFGWFDGRSIVSLNDRGSMLDLRQNSMPAGLDSALCRNWEWNEQPASQLLSVSQHQKIRDYNQALRNVREANAGLHYGIGGFFSLEPHGAVFQDSTLLTIAYADSELVGFSEEELAVFWEDSLGSWNHLPSLRDTASNTVSAWIPDFQTFTLAPRLPHGNYGLRSDQDSLAANGASIALITSDSLYNNDGSLIANGVLFRVESNRGQILDTDLDPAQSGTQVAVANSVISFSLQADSLAMPILVSVSSMQGFAKAELEIPLYDVSVPDAPVLQSANAEHNALSITWNEVDLPDIAGYRIWFDTDLSGAPYDGAATVWGTNSPVTVGLVNQHLLTGLLNDTTYYVVVTAFDVSGAESPISNELVAIPQLRAVDDLEISIVSDQTKLSWTAVTGASGYLIYRAVDPLDIQSEMILVDQTAATVWTDTETIVDGTRFYLVIVNAN